MTRVGVRAVRHRLPARCRRSEAGVSIATAYRYLHKALDVMAAHALGFDYVLDRAHAAGLLRVPGRHAHSHRPGRWPHRPRSSPVVLRQHHAFGGNLQVVFDPTGGPLWVSEVRPGSTRDRNARGTGAARAVRGLPGWATRATPAPASAFTSRSSTRPAGRRTS